MDCVELCRTFLFFELPLFYVCMYVGIDGWMDGRTDEWMDVGCWWWGERIYTFKLEWLIKADESRTESLWGGRPGRLRNKCDSLYLSVNTTNNKTGIDFYWTSRILHRFTDLRHLLMGNQLSTICSLAPKPRKMAWIEVPIESCSFTKTRWHKKK